MVTSAGLELRPEASKIHGELVKLSRWAENIGSLAARDDLEEGAGERMLRQSLAATRGCIQVVESLLQWLESSVELQRAACEADGLLAVAWQSRWQLRTDLDDLLRVCDAGVDPTAVQVATQCWQRVLDESRSLAATLIASAAARRSQGQLAQIEFAPVASPSPSSNAASLPSPHDTPAPAAGPGPRR